MFGKLTSPVEFQWKPYEECLCDIKVTHSPRYIIDMNLNKNQTIFSKMGTSYENFRKQDFPIELIKKYYKGLIKEDEYLWWLNPDHPAPLKLRLLNSLSKEDRLLLSLEGLVLFPELFGNSPKKFNNFMFYILKEYGLMSYNFRDMYTAGGQFEHHSSKNNQTYDKIPRIYKILVYNKELFLNIFSKYAQYDLSTWILKASSHGRNAYHQSRELLEDILI
jgi:hypothetical protein